VSEGRALLDTQIPAKFALSSAALLSAGVLQEPIIDVSQVTMPDTNLAIIPARGGSQRIPRKNIRLFNGRPVIEYSIEAARDSNLFTQIVVSTDCSEIAAIANSCGASILNRPAHLADDMTPLVPVVRDAIQTLMDPRNPDKAMFGYVCCLLATAPFVTPRDLIDSLEKLKANPSVDFMVPVTSFPYPIHRGLLLDQDRLALCFPEHELTRSQDLPETFHDAGQFYWGSANTWLKHDRIFSTVSAGYVMPRYRVQDLDTLEDWERAERMYRLMQQLEKSE
jgi:N-acylneuraminate cytidylyltransferase